MGGKGSGRLPGSKRSLTPADADRVLSATDGSASAERKGMGLSGHTADYRSPAAMICKIEEYIEFCRGEPVVGHDGKTLKDRNGNTIYVNQKPITKMSMLLYLGFKRYSDLTKFKKDGKYAEALDYMDMVVQAYAEERLYDKDGGRGAEFVLRCCYGWQDKAQTNTGGGGVIILPSATDGKDTTPVVDVAPMVQGGIADG